jgi:hypothetical protein
MTREIDGRLRESRRIVAQRPSIELLGSLEGEWRRLRRELYGFNRDLSGRVHELERYIVPLDDLAKPWDQTFAAAKESSVPPEVLARVEKIVHEIRQAHDAVEKQRGRALTMQTRVGMQDSRAANALMSIDQARESALDRLFLRESTPIWNLAIGSRDAQDLHSASNCVLGPTVASCGRKSAVTWPSQSAPLWRRKKFQSADALSLSPCLPLCLPSPCLFFFLTKSPLRLRL